MKQYLVYQIPRFRFRQSHVVTVAVIEAKSKAEALRIAKDHPGPDQNEMWFQDQPEFENIKAVLVVNKKVLGL